MKTPGLSPHLLVATLFLIAGLTVARAQNDAPSAAAARTEGDRASLERVLRAAVTANPAQLRRFDLNQDGKLDDNEWLWAKQEIQRMFSLSVMPSAVDEARRLNAVAAEVARRLALREAGKANATTPPPVSAQQEAEAKMLVKDLLEIGMAQRRADEARNKAATEPAAKK